MLVTSNFLFWRQPNQSSIEFFRLDPENKDTQTKVFIAPFLGSEKRFGVQAIERFDPSELGDWLELSLGEGKFETTSTKEEHIDLVRQAVEEIKQSTLQKVVLARDKVVPGSVDPSHLFLKFCNAYPDACVFLFYTPETGCWMGATPERLLALENGIAKAASLAGTRPVHTKGNWGEKEIEEQNLVTQSIQAAFAKQGLANIETTELTTKKAGPVEHLFCEVRGDIPNGLSSKELANALHPTPAVGGLPKTEALNYIREREKLDRSFYTGYFGVQTENSAQFYVNLRSMQLFANGLVLYAGGGITAASNPEAEWEETERKLRTLLDVI